MICSSCGAAQPAGLLCHDCTTKLEADLRLIAPGPIEESTDWRVDRAHLPVGARTVRGECGARQALPWEAQRRSWAGFESELTVTLARLDRTAPNLARGVSRETPMPYSQRASIAATELDRILTAAVYAVWDDRTDKHIPQTLDKLAHWLLMRINRLRAHDEAAQIMQAITDSVGAVLRVISAPAATYIHSPAVVISPETIMNRLATRRELLSVVLPAYDLQVSTNRFSMWLQRGKLVGHSVDRMGATLYRIGDVMTLAEAQPARKVTA